MRSDTCPLHDKLFKAVCMLFSFPLPRIKSVGRIFGCRGGSFMFRGTEETYQCWTIHLGDLHRRETFLSCCCQCTFRPLCHGRKTGTTTNCHGPGDSPVPSAHLSSSLCFISWAAGHFENKRMFVLSLLWGQSMRNTRRRRMVSLFPWPLACWTQGCQWFHFFLEDESFYKVSPIAGVTALTSNSGKCNSSLSLLLGWLWIVSLFLVDFINSSSFYFSHYSVGHLITFLVDTWINTTIGQANCDFLFKS